MVTLGRPGRSGSAVVVMAALGALLAVPTGMLNAATYPTVASDSFARSVGVGWGTADVGGAYSHPTSSGVSVSGGQGKMVIQKGQARSAVLPTPTQDVDLAMSVSIAPLPTSGNGVYFGPQLRRASDGSHYLPRLRVTPDRKVRLSLLHVNAAGGATLLTPESVLGFSASSGAPIAMRVSTSGGRSTELRAKAWPVGSNEPAWQREVTATNQDLGGTLGVWGYISSSSQNSTLSVDDLTVRSLVAVNEKPVAGFSAVASDLSVRVDGSQSVDADGQVQSYVWDFGDGTSGSGMIPAVKTYAQAGKYTVALTVTDDKGATDRATREVTVTKPNEKPVAGFSAVASDLSVRVDGSQSVDADGQVQSYVWDFGDGTSGSGMIPAVKTYAQAGKYTVALTVTDDKGATDRATREVTVTTPVTPATPGASLPIVYDLSSLTGSVLYVAPNGADSNSGTVSAPLATLATAVSRAPSGRSTIVVRGGTYRQGGITIPATKSIDIRAYSGERVVFSGAESANRSWTAEGTVAYRTYTARPVNFGSGLFDSAGFAKAVAQYPDQAWKGSQTLTQVLTKAELSAGEFYVDAANGRMYLTATDAAASDIEVSSAATFVRILGDETSLHGIRIERYSNSLGDYGVVRIEHPTSRTTPLKNVLLENVEIVGSAMQAVQTLVSDAAGYSRVYPQDIIDGVTFRHVTIADSNWMGIASNWTDGLTLDQVRITGSNLAGEFRNSPQSGALKTSRNRDIKVLDSEIKNNNSHGLWFDQSNYDVVVAGNTITGNNGSAVFWEISDKLLMVDNYVSAPASGANAVKIAGASGVRLVNNTLVGGRDVLGIYTDSRSKPGCADPSKPLCTSSYSSDRDGVRPKLATMDWMPRIDLMINNVVAHPTATGYCSGSTAMCVTTSNAGATAPVESILHQADSSRGIPKTIIDGNVYVNGSGAVVRAGSNSFTSAEAWSATLAVSPYSLPGQESAAKAGASWVNSLGEPTALLAAAHGEAVPVPQEELLNSFVPSGTRHYGAVSR